MSVPWCLALCANARLRSTRSGNWLRRSRHSLTTTIPPNHDCPCALHCARTGVHHPLFVCRMFAAIPIGASIVTDLPAIEAEDPARPHVTRAMEDYLKAVYR